MARVTATKSGAVATVKSPGRVPVRSLKVNFLPKQEGSGDPSPINIRNIIGTNAANGYIASKNLLTVNASTQTINGITFTVNSDGTVKAKGTANSTAVFYLLNSVGLDDYIGTSLFLAGCPKGGSNSTYGLRMYKSGGIGMDGADYGDGMTFTPDAKCRPAIVVINGVTLEEVFKPVISVASTSKTIPVEFPRTGNNLCPPLVKGIGISSDNGAEYSDNNSASSDYIPVDFVSNQYYSLNGLVDTLQSFVGAYNSSKQFLGRTSGANRSTLILQSSSFSNGTPQGTGNVAYIRIRHYVPAGSSVSIDLIDNAKIMLNEGSTALPYEPYNTVYGGYVDLVTGEIWGTWKTELLNDANSWTDGETYFSYTNHSYADRKIGDSYNFLCNSFPAVQKSTGTAYIRWGGSEAYNILLAHNSSGITLAEVKTMASSGNIVICYELATPVLLATLSPTELQTFIGVNNFWSDADSVTVEYDYAEPMDFVKKRMEIAAHADMVHQYETTGNPATFKTNVERPLKSLVVPFTPVQEGTGDPSPVNIRGIVGRNGMNAYRTGKNLFDEANADTYGRYIQAFVGTSYWSKDSTSRTKVFKAKPNTQYTVSGSNVNITIFRVAIIYDDPSTITVNDYPMEIAYDTNESHVRTFTTPNRECWILIQYNRVIAEPAEGQIQIELGSSASPYFPYTGTTANVKFPGVGKNLFDKNATDTSNGYKKKSLVIPSGNTWDSDDFNISEYIPVDGNTTYTLSPLSGGWPSIVFYDTNKDVISGEKYDSRHSITVTSPANAVYARVSIPIANIDSLQLEKGSSITTYEPFTNVVYGGYADLINGALVATHAIVEPNTNNSWQNQTAYFLQWGYPHSTIASHTTADKAIVSHWINKDKEGISPNVYIQSNGAFVFGSSVMSAIGVSTSAELNAWLVSEKNNGTPFQICIPLETPITFHLTPIQIQQLLGDNVIWSDTNGSNTVKFLKRG